MDKNIAYAFISGLYLGRFTNIITNFIITAIVVYHFSPETYTHANLEFFKNFTYHNFQVIKNHIVLYL